jgi:enoyl-CoA hydratase/carnithine racemase
MSRAESLVLTDIGSGIATVTLNRPAQLNAITGDMLTELNRTLAQLANADDVDVVVLTGAGRAFSAGVDIKALGERPLDGGCVGDVLDLPAREATQQLATMAKITIAKINGACFTGALELALACDFIVVADEAKLGDTHAKWGLRPTWGMSARLWRAVGITKARELSYTGRVFSGREASDWGLANLSVPLSELDTAVEDLARLVAANSAGSLAAYKQLYRESLNATLADGLAMEARTHFEIADTDQRIISFLSH